MPDVRLPDGTIVRNVPENVTREQVIERLRSSGQFDDEFLSGLSVEKTREEGLLDLAQQPGASSFSPTGDPRMQTGIGEAALQMATGTFAEPTGGIAGAVTAPFVGVDQSVRNIRGTSNFFTYRPRTQLGNQISEEVSAPFMMVERYADRIAEQTGRTPAERAAIKTALLTLPEIIPGVPAVLRRRRTIAEAVQSVESKAQELGLEFDSGSLREQTGLTADALTVDTLGAGMGEVAPTLRDMRNANAQHVDELYAEARSLPAEIDEANVQYLTSRVEDFLVNERRYNLGGKKFREVRRLLGEIDNLGAQSPNRAAQLEQIDNLKKEIAANRPRGKDPWAVAHDDMIREITSWENEMWTRDMIRGEPAALEAWRDARRANTVKKQRFSDRPFMNDLLAMNLTVEDMRKVVFGGNRTGFRSNTATILNHLRSIVGSDSPQWRALQKESIFRIVEPLVLGERPDFAKFNVEYDQFIRGNPSAVRALGLRTSDLDFLRRVTGAAERSGAAPIINIDMQRAVAQALVGHDIARRALAVRLATEIFRKVSGSGRSERRAILTEMIGYDPESPIVPVNSAAMAAFVIAQMDEEQ